MTAVLDLPDVEQARDFRRALRAFRPTPAVRLLDWSRENVVNEHGRPYDHAAYPHHGAPGGPMDELDNPRIREVSLQWATRTGKSFIGQCFLLKNAENNPAPQMFASSTEKLAKEVTARTYGMAEARRNLAALLVRPRKFRRQDLMEFRRCRVYVGWARSTSTLADKDVKFGHANEIPKWEHASTSKEAHPLKLFADRFKNFQSSRKILFEGSPTVAGRCPIERRLLAGTNCRLWVPCPKCKQYQPLQMGTGEGPGLCWEKTAEGKSDADLAKRTARYQCAHCPAKWEDHHRPWSIRRGVWVPAGCAVHDAKALAIAEGKTAHEWRGWKTAPWIKGTPLRNGDEASYQLSSLYALALTWGDVAKEFLDCKDRPQLLRNFRNQWEALTWQPVRSRSTPEQVGERLAGKTAKGVVPDGGRLLAVGIDRQGGDLPFVVFAVVAVGENDRAWTVDYGILATLEELWDCVLRRPYAAADRGDPLSPLIAACDSGFKTRETYQFCQLHPGVVPVKGSDDQLGGAPYRIVTLGDSARKLRSGADGQLLCHVNTDYWESELQARLEDRPPEGRGGLQLCAEAARDGEFLEQLMNGILGEGLDKRGNPRVLWIKKNENVPNDFRDAHRYALCAAQIWLDQQGGVLPPRGAGAAKSSALISAGIRRPDGRAWHER